MLYRAPVTSSARPQSDQQMFQSPSATAVCTASNIALLVLQAIKQQMLGSPNPLLLSKPPPVSMHALKQQIAEGDMNSSILSLTS